nr:signal peptidase I [Tessaracoccus coleopterorum]
MFIIPSGSMQNTLQVNDRVLVSKFGGFQRGDVVVFEDPGDWLPPTPPVTNRLQIALEFIGVLPNSGTEHLIKRVIGMPGDHVRLADDGRIEVNGVALDEAAYLYSENGVQVAPASVPFDIVVPKDAIFVMGDHRNQSNDSRCRLANVSSSPGRARSCLSTRWSAPPSRSWRHWTAFPPSPFQRRSPGCLHPPIPHQTSPT